MKFKKVIVKVTFTPETVLANGTNSCWFRYKVASIAYLIKYWRPKPNFYYLKVYDYSTGKVGEQLGFVTRQSNS